jgi:DNA replication protein DnaC
LDLRDASRNDSKTSEKQVLKKLEDVGLLVIDEFQERGESQWENRIVKNLIDKRYSDGRPTIIIANMTRGDMGAALGDSVKDRVRECGCVIEFNWTSYRAQ